LSLELNIAAAVGIARPEGLTCMAIHTLYPFGSVIGTDYNIRTAGTGTVKEKHTGTAQTTLARRIRSGLLPEQDIKKQTVHSICRHGDICPSGVILIPLLHLPGISLRN
jgi:hypothetical protein